MNVLELHVSLLMWNTVILTDLMLPTEFTSARRTWNLQKIGTSQKLISLYDIYDVASTIRMTWIYKYKTF